MPPIPILPIREHEERVRNSPTCSADSVQGEIRDFNLRIAEVAKQEEGRLEKRAAFIPARTNALYEAWLESMRAKFAAQAAGEFDAKQPPLYVPKRIELTEAHAIADRAYKARRARREGAAQ